MILLEAVPIIHQVSSIWSGDTFNWWPMLNNNLKNEHELNNKGLKLKKEEILEKAISTHDEYNNSTEDPISESEQLNILADIIVACLLTQN